MKQEVRIVGLRKTIVTRLGPKRWVPALGYISDVQLKVQRPCATRRMARAYATDWLERVS